MCCVHDILEKFAEIEPIVSDLNIATRKSLFLTVEQSILKTLKKHKSVLITCLLQWTKLGANHYNVQATPRAKNLSRDEKITLNDEKIKALRYWTVMETLESRTKWPSPQKGVVNFRRKLDPTLDLLRQATQCTLDSSAASWERSRRFGSSGASRLGAFQLIKWYLGGGGSWRPHNLQVFSAHFPVCIMWIATFLSWLRVYAGARALGVCWLLSAYFYEYVGSSKGLLEGA